MGPVETMTKFDALPKEVRELVWEYGNMAILLAEKSHDVEWLRRNLGRIRQRMEMDIQKAVV